MSSILTAGGLAQSVGRFTAEQGVTRLQASSPFMVSERENVQASGCSCVTSCKFPNGELAPRLTGHRFNPEVRTNILGLKITERNEGTALLCKWLHLSMAQMTM